MTKNIYDVNIFEKYLEKDKPNYTVMIILVVAFIMAVLIGLRYIGLVREEKKLEAEIAKNEAQIQKLIENIDVLNTSQLVVEKQQLDEFQTYYKQYVDSLYSNSIDLSDEALKELAYVTPDDVFYTYIEIGSQMYIEGYAKTTDDIAQLYRNMREIEKLDSLEITPIQGYDSEYYDFYISGELAGGTR